MSFAEADYENAVLELFRDTLGYGYVYGPDVERDYSEPLHRDELLPALRRVNPRLPVRLPASMKAVERLRDRKSVV